MEELPPTAPEFEAMEPAMKPAAAEEPAEEAAAMEVEDLALPPVDELADAQDTKSGTEGEEGSRTDGE